MKYFIIIFMNFVFCAACSNNKIISDTPDPNGIHGVICGDNFSDVTLKLIEERIVESSGYFGDSFSNLAKAIIITGYKADGMSNDEIRANIDKTTEDYVQCLNKNRVYSVVAGSHARWSAISCRRMCCDKYDCDDDCSMTEIEGIMIPRDNGSPTACPTVKRWYPKFSCEEKVKEGENITYCGPRDNIVSFDDMRNCINTCPQLKN